MIVLSDNFMEREKMIKTRFKPYMLIDFKHSQLKDHVECMLVSINFDTEIMVLRPFPNNNPFVDEEFPVHISHCELAKQKLKLVK